MSGSGRRSTMSGSRTSPTSATSSRRSSPRPSRSSRSGAATRGSGRSSCGRASLAASPALTSLQSSSNGCVTAIMACDSSSPIKEDALSLFSLPMATIMVEILALCFLQVWMLWWPTCSTCHLSQRALTLWFRRAPWMVGLLFG